jgi:hypothetical protein
MPYLGGQVRAYVAGVANHVLSIQSKYYRIYPSLNFTQL